MSPFRSARSLLSVAVLCAAAACADQATQPGRPRPALTALPRALTPAEHAIIGAANAFSFALFHTVSSAQRDSDVFLSPLSASMSLGMALNGAANETFDETRSALQLGGASQQDINAGYKSLIALLTSLDPAVQMQIANSIWHERTFPFYQSFLDTAKTYFDAEVRPLDFSDVSGSLAAINGWVDTKTNGKIPTILDDIHSDDVMFLVNAIYFNGNWRAKFDPAETRGADFHTASGAVQSMQLMHRHGVMSYAEGQAYQAVDLPYGDSAFTMTVLLPSAGTSVEALADSLTPSFWSALTARLHAEEMDLYLPKLKLSYGRKLNDDLAALGMRVPFVPDQADFTRMSSMGTQLYIKFVKQKSYVDVNEAGTEAAAVTVTGVGVTSYHPPVVMRVDHPYMFVIRERLSGTVLFMAKIASMPAA